MTTAAQTKRLEWLAERRTGIGGSDAAAVLGLSKWATPYQLYLEKTGAIEDDGLANESMHWGNVLEPAIRQEYANRTGREILQPTGIIRKPDAPFMLASLDGYTQDERIVEIKTARTASEWGEPGTDEIPIQYLIQAQHYMAVTGYKVTDVPVLIGGSDFRIYVVQADPELQALLIEAERQFWERVLTQNPPPPLSAEDHKQFYQVRAASVIASSEVEKAVMDLKTVKSELKALEQREADLKLKLMAFLKDHDTLTGVGGNVLATWKETKPPKRFDTDRFKEEHPELYAQYIKPAEASRQLRLK